MTNQKRTPAGVPTGGEFAANSHDEARPILPGYTYEERKTVSGAPAEHMQIGESRSARTSSEYAPLTVESFRFKDGTKVVMLTPGDKYADWDDYESRATFLAQSSEMRGTVERVNNYRDWLRRKEHPLYVVTLAHSVKDPVTHEYQERTMEVAFINPSTVPDRIDGIVRAVETARTFEEYEDERDYAYQSGKEHEDAIGEYHELQEERDNLHAFLGEEEYQKYVNGIGPGVRYETREFTR